MSLVKRIGQIERLDLINYLSFLFGPMLLCCPFPVKKSEVCSMSRVQDSSFLHKFGMHICLLFVMLTALVDEIP